MSNAEQLKSLKVNANSIVIGEFVIVRKSRKVYRLGELGGDWLMHGSLEEIESRMEKGRKNME